MANTNKIIRNILTGKWLGSEIKPANMYYILFVVTLIIFLIYNRYRTEELVIKKRTLKNDVEILHSKHTKIETKLMILGTERKVAQDSTIIKLGLKLPETPLKQIIIEKLN
ncbi:MAG: hypothetical protein L3J35_06120 [Bacteroidales bacterium]|nr:hypothetical protein [Bacteroidales bacterium]